MNFIRYNNYNNFFYIFTGNQSLFMRFSIGASGKDSVVMSTP